MAEPLKEVSLNQSQALKNQEMLIFGRVEKVSRNGDKHYTLLIAPSDDPYRGPSTFDIQSSDRFANPGDEVRVVVLGRGIKNTYTVPKTGEVVNSARHFYDFIRFFR